MWEIDSLEWHLGPADYDQTLARHSLMTAHGLTVVHTRPGRLRYERTTVRRELERAYVQCTSRPRPILHPGPKPASGALVG